MFNAIQRTALRALTFSIGNGGLFELNDGRDAEIASGLLLLGAESIGLVKIK